MCQIASLCFAISLTSLPFSSYSAPRIIFHVDHQNLVIPTLAEQDHKALKTLLPEIPVWIKYPDHDRVSSHTFKRLSEELYIVPVKHDGQTCS